MPDKRLKILSKSEINELYELPNFNEQEQRHYFTLNEDEYRVMQERGSLASKVYFILQLGYFKAASQFFNCSFKEVKNDVNFILQAFFQKIKLKNNKVSKQTRHTNQALISNMLKFETDKSVIQQKLQKILEIKSKLSCNPISLFQDVLCYSEQQKFMLLGYTTIQELIGNAIISEERRLGALLEQQLSSDQFKLIKGILNKCEDDYVLKALQKDPKSFKPKEIKFEIKKLLDHDAIYDISKMILPKLAITSQTIHYYASLMEHYSINHLIKLSTTKQAIYILCYVFLRYQKVNDNLTVSFAYYIEKFKAAMASSARDKLLDDKFEINNDVKNAAVVLRFFDDQKIADTESFGSIRRKAEKYVKKGNFNILADYLTGLLFDFQEIKWDQIAQLKNKITTNVRPIFNALEFSGDSNQENLLSAIKFLKTYFSSSTNDRNAIIKDAPIKCIPSNWRKYLIKDGLVDPSKYEFMIYQLVVEKIQEGHLYLQNSISFKSFSSYLVSGEKWKDKLTLLEKLGNKKLSMPINDILNDLEGTLEKLIKKVNANIKNGTNKGIKIKKNGDEIKFTLPYPDTIDKENHFIFNQIPQVSIAEILKFTQNECGFIRAFTHIKPYDAKDTLDPIAIMACIIANATNLGIYKMAKSSDLDYHRIYSQMKNFMRLETLREANDIIIDAIAKLPIFKYWNIKNNTIHGSVDGQKFETRLNSFIARYSSKYFGINRGIVAYTLCANHIPVNTKIISANQHESHFLFDILFNNTSEININCVSGDGHSINQLNFLLLDFIEKQFSPHFKRINHKAESLCGFKPLQKYKNLLIKPQHKANTKIIKAEWDNIQRTMVSLLLGESSQHLVVSKLSSHKRKNKTKEALWEYDRIHMSIYMLKFINDPIMRMNVRRSLNRIESFHKLRRAIANVHGGKFRGKSEREIELWNECARLMANCMIYYNARLLNALLENLQKEGNKKSIELLKFISPIAWLHINLYGYYKFEDEKPMQIDINNLVSSIKALNSA